MSCEENAQEELEFMCNKFPGFKKNIELLDQYDFSEFLVDGMNLHAVEDAIEQKYDKHFWEKYGIYVFDELGDYDIQNYFCTRYNVWFQEYIDWVVRHDRGANEKTRRRVEDSPGKMEE